MSTAIHRSSHLIGVNATVYAHPIKYYHYHKTINKREEVCQEFVPSSKRDLLYRDPKNTEEIFLYDGGMKELSSHIKEFELDAIGPQPFILWSESKPVLEQYTQTPHLQLLVREDLLQKRRPFFGLISEEKLQTSLLRDGTACDSDAPHMKVVIIHDSLHMLV